MGGSIIRNYHILLWGILEIYQSVGSVCGRIELRDGQKLGAHVEQLVNISEISLFTSSFLSVITSEYLVIPRPYHYMNIDFLVSLSWRAQSDAVYNIRILCLTWSRGHRSSFKYQKEYALIHHTNLSLLDFRLGLQEI